MEKKNHVFASEHRCLVPSISHFLVQRKWFVSFPYPDSGTITLILYAVFYVSPSYSSSDMKSVIFKGNPLFVFLPYSIWDSVCSYLDRHVGSLLFYFLRQGAGTLWIGLMKERPSTSRTRHRALVTNDSVTLTDTTALCLKCDLLPWKQGHPLASKQPVNWILGHSCVDEGSHVCHCFSS